MFFESNSNPCASCCSLLLWDSEWILFHRHELTTCSWSKLIFFQAICATLIFSLSLFQFWLFSFFFSLWLPQFSWLCYFRKFIIRNVASNPCSVVLDTFFSHDAFSTFLIFLQSKLFCPRWECSAQRLHLIQMYNYFFSLVEVSLTMVEP